MSTLIGRVVERPYQRSSWYRTAILECLCVLCGRKWQSTVSGDTAKDGALMVPLCNCYDGPIVSITLLPEE